MAIFTLILPFVQRAISDIEYEENLCDPTFFNFDSGLRALRNKVYGVPTTDGNWTSCRLFWLRPDNHRFLMEQSKKKL